MSTHELNIASDKNPLVVVRNKGRQITKRDMYNIMKAMEAYGGVILPEQHVEDQFEPWMDTMYIDFQMGEHIITLHWEHYTGIYLLSDTADATALAALWAEVKPLVK